MRSERQAQGCTCGKLLSLLAENARLTEENGRLKTDNARLREDLGRVRRTALERPFGVSTPSSRQLVKPSAETPPTEEEARMRRGGARAGHPGHGWRRLGEPEETVRLPDPTECPHCHGPLADPAFGPDEETRDVVVSCPVKAHVRRYVRRVRRCPNCGMPVRARVPGVMDGCRYANSLVARAATDFFLHGVPAGVVSRQTGVGKGTLLGLFARVAGILAPVRERLLRCVRSADVAQGDETPWRIDGRNGYAWVFISGNVVAYTCAATRASSVAKEALGGFRGVYLSDRYAGYAFLHRRAFCLEHLRRDVLKVAEENPKDAECRSFADAAVPVLARIMGLRREYGDDPAAYRRESLDAAGDLYAVMSREARHPEIQKLQDVFRDARLAPWQWLAGPEVPAENNRSEREVRPLACARKVSHGSQSDDGAETRGVLMTVLHTLGACGADPCERLERALDAYAADSGTDMFRALFEGLDLALPLLSRRPVTKLPAAVTATGEKAQPLH